MTASGSPKRTCGCAGPAFRLADLGAHADLLGMARDDAAMVVGRDADLASAHGQAIRSLLYLFERDAAVRTTRSG
jgi:ATP-dependent DNA helicase RecG